jgi:hypothetical protein
MNRSGYEPSEAMLAAARTCPVLYRGLTVIRAGGEPSRVLEECAVALSRQCQVFQDLARSGMQLGPPSTIVVTAAPGPLR